MKIIEKEIVIEHGSHDWNDVKKSYETDDTSICVEKYYDVSNNNKLIALKLVNYLYGATTNEKTNYKEIRKQMYKFSKPFFETNIINVYHNIESVHHIKTDVSYFPEANVSIIKDHAYNHEGDWLYTNYNGIYPGMPNVQNTQLYNDRTCEWYINSYWRDAFLKLKSDVDKSCFGGKYANEYCVL